MKDLKEFSNEKKLMIAAHRGASGTFPENTMPAFQEAINNEVELIELDIHFSKDGKIVVYHDEIINNMNENISEITCNKMQNDDIADKMLLLSDVIELAKDKVYLIIEIKPAYSDEDSHRQNLMNLIDLLTKTNFKSQAILASFDINNLIFIKSQDKNIYTAAIYYNKIAKTPSEYKAKCNCDAFICHADELNTEITNDAKQNDIIIGVYGVETQETFYKMWQYGVKVIGTDFPQKVINFMNTID